MCYLPAFELSSKYLYAILLSGVRQLRFAIEHWEDALDRIEKMDDSSLVSCLFKYTICTYVSQSFAFWRAMSLPLTEIIFQNFAIFSE